MMFTHYSLFEAAGKTLRDFAPLPSGGLSDLLADLHGRTLPGDPNYCCGIGRGTLHPSGEQVSFSLDVNGTPKFFLILFTPQACRDQAVELESEGNASAVLARGASV